MQVNEYSWGMGSKTRLATCHPDMVTVADFVLGMGIIDLTILWGYRSKGEQNAMADAVPPTSMVYWPMSYHNMTDEKGMPLSDALDFAPWLLLPNGKMGIPWKDTHTFAMVGGLFLAAGAALEIPVVWGGDFDRDGLTIDHSLGDYGHIQRVRA